MKKRTEPQAETMSLYCGTAGDGEGGQQLSQIRDVLGVELLLLYLKRNQLRCLCGDNVLQFVLRIYRFFTVDLIYYDVVVIFLLHSDAELSNSLIRTHIMHHHACSKDCVSAAGHQDHVQ